MLWVTKKRIRIGRAATCWLIERFVDTDAAIRFVDEADIPALQENGAIGFHARGARYPAVDERGRTPFEALVLEHRRDDRALVRMAAIVHDADRPPKDRAPAPEAEGLRMITVGFPDVCDDDHEIVRRSRLLYDALYHALAKATGNPRA